MNYSHFVGLDVGKKSFDACLVSLDKELSHHTFPNTPGGIEELLHWVKQHGLEVETTLFCAENMGSYVIDLCLSSHQFHFPLALECPLTIKRSIGLQRGKNDRIDARRIARYACLHYRKLRLYELPDKDLVRLRNWMVIRDNLVKQKVSSLKLLELTRETSGLADLVTAMTFLEKQISLVKEKISYVEQEMEKIISSNIALLTNYQLLTSIKGIGPVNAIVLLCVTGNFHRFSDPRKFACYCGVAPFEHSSGTSTRGKTKTSNLANREVKVYLTRAAITAISWDPQIKAYYKRKTGEGKHKASVINAVRAKIIARCFAVIKRKTPFVTLRA